MNRILLSVPHMGGAEQSYVREAFATNWLSTVGPNVTALEEEFERFLGLPCVAVSSGTAAIHLGLRLLDVGFGDTVFCSTLTFAASANPIRYLGAEPVWIDSDSRTWNMDPQRLLEALRHAADVGALPKAVVVVHLYGQCADMDPIREACAHYGVPVLEDAAEALGATYKNQPAGTLGDVAAFSFNGNKIITTTGGGMLLCRDRAWAEKARFWSQQARDPGLAYEHSQLGYNYAMSNVLAGIGRGQLEVLDLRVRQRRAIAFRYREAFADLAGIEPMPQADYGLHTNWLSCFLMDERKFGASRNALIQALDAAHVESRPVWKPMHLQPLYAGCTCYGGEVAADLSRRGICLPSSSSLSEQEQLVVVNAVRKAAGAAVLTHLSQSERHAAGAECKTVPGRCEIIEANGVVGQIREVAVEDLLGRSPIRLDDSKIRSTLQGRVVLVTGAAGSIGSELCRQIARFHPAGIVGLDIAESPLFEIDREMRRTSPSVPFYPEIGSIQNRARLDDVLGQYRPSVLYHAAAYKHVPLMEAHVFEAIENNVFGTCNVAAAAAQYGVENLVMISSDKAVRPTNVMGASKRIAELLLLALQNGRTRYVAVRFGNVLGSNGSVLPIFQQQIAGGGPITVTDPEMRRFVMTIPEACQLVLQASVLGQGGQICVLDMGPPVKIVDLARNLIRLSGLKPEQDIKIEFTGMRPGEKLYEEVSTLLEDTVPTDHDKVRIFIGNAMPDQDMHGWLDSLHAICQARDIGRLVVALKEMVPDYTPSAHLLTRMESRDGNVAAL